MPTPTLPSGRDNMENVMSTHTAGPWEAGRPDGGYHDVIRIYGHDKERLAEAVPVAVCFQQKSAIMEVLSGSTDETTEAAANARLIAAAPELLSALEGLVRYAEAVRMTAGMGKSQQARLDAAKAALAKARGQ